MRNLTSWCSHFSDGLSGEAKVLAWPGPLAPNCLFLRNVYAVSVLHPSQLRLGCTVIGPLKNVLSEKLAVLAWFCSLLQLRNKKTVGGGHPGDMQHGGTVPLGSL